jgi:uncharacterized protein (UPF0261 family)
MSRKKQQLRSIDAVWDDGTAANQTEELNRLMRAFSAAGCSSVAVDVQTRRIVATAEDRRRAVVAGLRELLREVVFLHDVPADHGTDSPSVPEAPRSKSSD